MSSKVQCSARLALFAAVVVLLAASAPAQAQPGRCSPGGSRQASLPRSTGLQALPSLQRTSLQAQPGIQQTGLQAQLPPLQDPLLVALQQQNAQLLALQRQNALLAAQVRQLQQQSAQPTGQQVPQAPPNRPSPGAAGQAEKSTDAESRATRKLQAARDLLADATRANFEGESDRAARMRQRAAERLRDVVKQYPGTQAADQAQRLLARADS